MSQPHHSPSRAHAARGFTLVELMIAILIGLFIVGGLLTLVSAMRRTTVSQNGLSQLQDNERMVMTLIGDVIQSAGYFPDPTVNSASSSFPVGGVFTLPAQSLYGTDAAAGDTITVRYLTDVNDKLYNCAGATSGASALYTNTFSVAGGNLVCTAQVAAAAPTTVNLVTGITNLQILYGVKTNPSTSNNSVDTYLTAAAVSAGNYWNSVLSVKITVTFTNPLFGQPGQTTVPSINFTRIVSVMNKSGVVS